jgi:hypothetical protein
VSFKFRLTRLAREKPRGIGHEVSEYKRRMRRVSLVVTFLAVFCIAIVVSFYFEAFFSGSGGVSVRVPSNGNSLGGTVSDGGFRAVVVDALYGNYSNDAFTDYVGRTLRGTGFCVDFFEAGVVTVDFLERFPSGYKLVIFRVHSALSSMGELYLFTAEPYVGDQYVDEQGFGLVRGTYADDGSRPVFGVDWGFVRRLMAGRFNGSVVVVMGCNGARDRLMTDVFLDQGAVGYVGFDGPVLLSHSDEAIMHLVEEVYVGKQPLKKAVDDTNTIVGADPVSGSMLKCFAR